MHTQGAQCPRQRPSAHICMHHLYMWWRFPPQSRASSRLSEKNTTLQSNVGTVAGATNARTTTKAKTRERNTGSSRSTIWGDARSENEGSLYSAQEDVCSTAAGTASTDTGIGSEASYARRYLQNQIVQSPHQTAFAQRVAMDAKTSVVTRKLVTGGMGKAMGGTYI